jgi:hypothetical protein
MQSVRIFEADTFRTFHIDNETVYLDTVSENLMSIELYSTNLILNYELSLEPNAMNVIYVKDSFSVSSSYYSMPLTLIESLAEGDSILIKKETQGCFGGSMTKYSIHKLLNGYLLKQFYDGKIESKNFGQELVDIYGRIEREVMYSCDGCGQDLVSGTFSCKYSIWSNENFLEWKSCFLFGFTRLESLLD